MPAAPFVTFDAFDENRVVFDRDTVRQINPQRDAMEQLSWICHVDQSTDLIIGVKEITDREFWVTGHFPGFPLMPGVIMCEAAAQLAAFYTRKYDLMKGDFLGFGGMENVRFRFPIQPPCRLVIQARMSKLRPGRLSEFEFQGYVERKLAFNGTMIGVPINRDHGMQREAK